MRMTFGSNAFFGSLKPAGQPVYWFDSYAADESDIEKINNPTGYARDELVDAGRHALRVEASLRESAATRSFLHPQFVA
jgi:hypothetical protein